MMIRMTIVVGLYVFIGNSGILSFGHIGFVCIGAYAAGWATADPSWKQLMLSGLPSFLQDEEYPFLVAQAGAMVLPAIVALALGAAIMRLRGIGASIATFAFLMIPKLVLELGFGHGRRQFIGPSADRRRSMDWTRVCRGRNCGRLSLSDFAPGSDAQGFARR
jgi:ABC-type branched-subunit amino acid transport system permease subunit